MVASLGFVLQNFAKPYSEPRLRFQCTVVNVNSVRFDVCLDCEYLWYHG